MYEKFENTLPPKFSCMYIGRGAKIDMGPPSKRDTITIRASENTNFYIQVDSLNDGYIQGEITGIGPNPVVEYDDWKRGSKIQVKESAVTAIIRAS